MPTRDLARIAMFAAVTAALGLAPPIVVPVVPVPITAQTLGVMLAGAILGARRGAASQLVFLGLVAAGLPLLAGGRGGIGVFLGPTGGFALAFPLGAFVVGAVTGRLRGDDGLVASGLAMFAGGVVTVYALGIPWLALVGELGWRQAAVGSLVFLPGDLVKVAVAASVTVTVRRAYPVAHPT